MGLAGDAGQPLEQGVEIKGLGKDPQDVGVPLQASQDVLAVVGRGDNEDGQMRAGHLDRFDELEAIPVRHGDIAEDDVVGVGCRQLEPLMAVIGGINRKTGLLQAGAQQMLGGFGIFKHKNTHGSLWHGISGCL